MVNSENTQPMDISQPDPALKRLEKLIGTWELKGRTLSSDEDNITGRTTFEWMPGGFFLKVSGEMSFKGFAMQSLEIIGYDPATKKFSSHVYSTMSGDVPVYTWDVQGDTVIHGGMGATYTGTFSENGKVLSGGWRPDEGTESSDGAAYDATMIRVDD